jgi:hypothetical protein
MYYEYGNSIHLLLVIALGKLRIPVYGEGV